jgi:hypothetical protein
LIFPGDKIILIDNFKTSGELKETRRSGIRLIDFVQKKISGNKKTSAGKCRSFEDKLLWNKLFLGLLVFPELGLSFLLDGFHRDNSVITGIEF